MLNPRKKSKLLKHEYIISKVSTIHHYLRTLLTVWEHFTRLRTFISLYDSGHRAP